MKPDLTANARPGGVGFLGIAGDGRRVPHSIPTGRYVAFAGLHNAQSLTAFVSMSPTGNLGLISQATGGLMQLMHRHTKPRLVTSTSRTGFTLVELLVVIAIVAVLISLLLPAIARSKDRAREIACSGNLHQNMLALSSYLEDYNDVLPTPWSSAWDGFPVVMASGAAYNQGLLYPYLGNNASTLFCTDMIAVAPGWWRVFTDPKFGANTFDTNWKNKTVKTYTSYGMPRRWDDPLNSPPPSMSGGPYDIYKQQQDIQCYIAIKSSYNMPPWSKGGRSFPIMACLQQWSSAPGPISMYGAHRGEMSNFAYTDGVVLPLRRNYRASGQNLFASSATWAFFTRLR